jgi:hypothetical protein
MMKFKVKCNRHNTIIWTAIIVMKIPINYILLLSQATLMTIRTINIAKETAQEANNIYKTNKIKEADGYNKMII